MNDAVTVTGSNPLYYLQTEIDSGVAPTSPETSGSNSVVYQPSSLDSGMTSMSPETLLAYCQMQLGDLDGQIKTQMDGQRLALTERTALQNAQTVFGQFGAGGPQNVQDMQTCLNSIDAALAQFPPNDPAQAQLVAFRAKVCSDYQYQPPGTLAQAQATELTDDMNIDQYNHDHDLPLQYTARINELEALKASGSLGNKPESSDVWKGTTDALDNIGSDIKSNADIELLQLQDLVSQRQQAVQLVTGMMGKADQTLEDQAKAIGQ